MVDCQTSASVWSTLELALASPSNSWIMQCMALFRIFDKVIILSLSTCNAQKVYLMNWLWLVDLFISLISTYMCVGDFTVNFVIWLQVYHPKLTLFHILSSIITYLLMDTYIAAQSPPVCLLNPYCPPLRSLLQYMLPFPRSNSNAFMAHQGRE